MDGRSQVDFAAGAVLIFGDEPTELVPRFCFHGAAVERSADLEGALDVLIEIADGDGGHEQSLA